MAVDEMAFIEEGAAVVGMAGVIAAILLSPKSGKETRDSIKAHLVEIKDKLVARLKTLEDFTQDGYDEIVGSLITEYEAAEKIPANEAREIEADLRDGYEAIRKTVCEHGCGSQVGTKPAAKPAHPRTARPAKSKG